MSIEYCDKCDTYIDTDFNAEHFGENGDECETTFEEPKSRDIGKIVKIIKDALQLPSEQGLLGEYMCHEDIPEETPIGFDKHFTACGKDEDDCYLILIKKV